MFSGIISSIGTIRAATRTGDLRIEILCDFDDLAIGESVACNGACLTVIDKQKGSFSAELSAETLACTAPRWNIGATVNLERSLRLGDMLSGHLVSGHVDGLAIIRAIVPEGDSHQLQLEAPAELARYIATKGSATLDGVSLTVNQIEGTQFWVNIIPHTWQHTTLGTRTTGDSVNMEIDMIARYVERLLQKAL
ncbi:MAG: riboflavin synthase [Rickettsiales bacterium]|nr:riboflavin synthase [Rickettsiales bacterium]